ncbi:hypothetical protein KY362_02640 [Candidatus Woesearchaeota archaeon]|nr:hypothetical protein [Candidatus Woesearchaeota archaeon]
MTMNKLNIDDRIGEDILLYALAKAGEEGAEQTKTAEAAEGEDKGPKTYIFLTEDMVLEEPEVQRYSAKAFEPDDEEIALEDGDLEEVKPVPPPLPLATNSVEQDFFSNYDDSGHRVLSTKNRQAVKSKLEDRLTASKAYESDVQSSPAPSEWSVKQMTRDAMYNFLADHADEVVHVVKGIGGYFAKRKLANQLEEYDRIECGMPKRSDTDRVTGEEYKQVRQNAKDILETLIPTTDRLVDAHYKTRGNNAAMKDIVDRVLEFQAPGLRAGKHCAKTIQQAVLSQYFSDVQAPKQQAQQIIGDEEVPLGYMPLIDKKPKAYKSLAEMFPRVAKAAATATLVGAFFGLVPGAAAPQQYNQAIDSEPEDKVQDVYVHFQTEGREAASDSVAPDEPEEETRTRPARIYTPRRTARPAVQDSDGETGEARVENFGNISAGNADFHPGYDFLEDETTPRFRESLSRCLHNAAENPDSTYESCYGRR